MRRVVDEHLEHEAVDLRLGQRVRALGLDRVLRREHEERARAPGSVLWPIVTWRSCITSSSADCTFAGARLISSASRKLQKTGPRSVSKSALSGRKTRVPTRSLGTRSGVNCTRLNEPPSTAAVDLIVSVFARPGNALDQQVPAGEQAHEHALEHLLLAGDHAPDLEQRLLELLAHVCHVSPPGSGPESAPRLSGVRSMPLKPKDYPLRGSAVRARPSAAAQAARCSSTRPRSRRGS